MCSINIIELLLGFFLGVLASIIASYFVLNKERSNKRKEAKCKWYKYHGIYEGFGYIQGSNSIINPVPQSKAEIKYIQDNKLTISLKHDKREWTGLIIMDFENFGSIVWQYKPEQKNEHIFGFKRCIFNEEEDRFCIYLVGEPHIDNCSKEILIRQKK